MPVTEFELDHPFLIHAKLGAYLAGKKYGVEDPEILDAITWHTTGKPEMSKLEMIIYIADYIEPQRDKARGWTRYGGWRLQIWKNVCTRFCRTV